ncbi:MAG: hypothetical protein A2X32_03575 [Elusimicrobia bacterium GWC2_64_44]|nr:MAG: hypothetical protein A2X32_03575 [Elusimicrobia bacterium GWC2_64_44]
MRTALLLACLLAADAAAAQDVAFKVTPPAGAVKLAEKFSFSVEAVLPENYSLRADTAAASNSEFETLSFTRLSERKEGGRKTELFEVKARAYTLGVSTFPAIPWGLRGEGVPADTVVKTEPFNVEVKPLFKIKEGEDIKDIYPPYSYIPWLLLALAALAAAALVWQFYKRFAVKAGTPAFARAAWHDARDPYQRARERLDRLVASPLAREEKFKSFYTGITSILRLYLAEEFSIDAVLMTTADLGREIKKTGADLKTILRARELLQKADMVKFAKLRPDGAADDAAAAGELLMEFRRLAENARALAAEAAAKAAADARLGKRGRK